VLPPPLPLNKSRLSPILIPHPLLASKLMLLLSTPFSIYSNNSSILLPVEVYSAQTHVAPSDLHFFLHLPATLVAIIVLSKVPCWQYRARSRQVNSLSQTFHLAIHSNVKISHICHLTGLCSEYFLKSTKNIHVSNFVLGHIFKKCIENQESMSTCTH
jgi:hypothetical protein